MMDDETRRYIDDLLAWRTAVGGTVTLATSGTTTTVTRKGVSSSSVVSLTPYDDGAKTEGIPKVVPTKGAFTITHTSTATARNYRYVIHTPQG